MWCSSLWMDSRYRLAHRSPSFPQSAYSIFLLGALRTPEEGNQADRGWRYESADGRFGLSAAVYLIDKENVAYTDWSGYPNLNRTFASDSKTVRGEPVEPRFLPMNALRPLSLPKHQGERMEQKCWLDSGINARYGAAAKDFLRKSEGISNLVRLIG